MKLFTIKIYIEKLIREMLEEYVQGIYVYDDERVEVEWKKR